MTIWDERVEQQPLWALVGQAKAVLDGLSTKDPAVLEKIDRIRCVLGIVNQYRTYPDMRMFPASAMTGTHQAVQNLFEHVSQYATNPEGYTSNLDSAANDYADAVLASLGSLPPLVVDKRVQAATAAAKEYQESAQGLLKLVERRSEELSARLVVAAEQEQARQAQADQELQDLRTRIAEAEGSITQHVARLDQAITSKSSAFDTAQGERVDRFERDLSTQNEKADQALTKVEESARTRAQEQIQGAAQHVEKLQRLEAEAEQLVKATGRHAITTEHGQYAQDQRRQAFWWSMGAVFAALAGAAWIIYAISRVKIQETSWQLVIYKLGATITLLALAGYAGKQAAEHRQQERDAKHTQLVINALEPFLTGLPEVQADELRVKIATDAFARRTHDASGDDANSGAGAATDFANLESLINTIVKGLKDVKT